MNDVREVRATFPSDAALQDGIAQLELAGFDRAEISLPRPSASGATPDAGAEVPDTEEDNAQMRTIHTSMAATVGALAAAGATIATGGAAAVAIAAAAAAGIGAGGVAHVASQTADTMQHGDRAKRAETGELVLSVVTRDAAGVQRARSAMTAAGATDVE